MTNRTVEVGLKISGDASGATKALSDTERELLSLKEASQKIALLEGAEARAKEFASKMQAAQQEVRKLETTLSEALNFGADDKVIRDVGAKLKAAEKEAEGLAKSIKSNADNLVRLRFEASQAGVAVSRLADEKIRIEQAAQAAAGLSKAFNTLGVRPLRAVLDETERLRAALATIKASGLPFEDKERAIAAFNEKLAALRKEVSLVPGATASANAGLASMTNGANSTAAALGSAAKSAALALAALAGLHGIGDIAKDVVNTGAAFETLEMRLTGLLGSSEAAKDAMEQIKQLALSTPFEVSALSESFTKLTAFGLQPSMEQMRALADTVAALGGGTEALSGVTLALGQAWAKGKLQGDEIIQLAERGVSVWDALEKATGKNTSELQRMSAAGELGRSTILKLFDALGQANAGASEKLMATFSGAVSNAKDALAEFYDMVAKAGVLEFLTGQLQDLLAEFDRMKQSGELQAEAQRLADSFVAFGEGVRTAVEAVQALSGTIKFGLEVWAAWRLAGMTLIPVLAGVGRQAAITAAETTAMAVASETAAVGVGRLAVAIRLIKGLTLVGLIEGVISLGTEFFRAKKAAEDTDRAIKKMQEPAPENGPKDAIKAVATETEAARFRLTEYQRALKEMQAQGKSTGEALEEMAKKADLSTTQGVVDFLVGLESVRQGVQATGEQIRVSLQERLNRMTAEDLRAFGLMAESAFSRGKISAEQLAETLNGTVDASLKKLGASTEVFAGGMTSKFIEAAQLVGVVEASFVRLQESGQNAGAILHEAFGGALNVASSIKDFEGLEVSIKAAGEAGRLSKEQVADFLDKIREKVDAVMPGVNSLAEAFRTLGMKSPQELRKAADAAQAAFEVIKNSADFTSAGVNNTREAFRRYAEAAIAANGGVASEMIKAQAWVNGFSVEVDKSGKTVLQAVDALNQYADGLRSGEDTARWAADANKQLANSLDSVAESAASAEEAQRRLEAARKGETRATAPIFDPRRAVLAAGVEQADLDEVTSRLEYLIERQQAQGTGRKIVSQRGIIEPDYSGLIRQAMADVYAGQTDVNNRAAAAKIPDTVEPVVQQNAAVSSPAAALSIRRVQIDLRGSGGTTRLYADDEASADSFIRMLERDARRSR